MNARGDDISDLKARLRLSDYVSRKVKLRREGHDLFGRCPFHAEKTASFSVNDAKGFYHCFGCNAHGDLLDWWQKAEGLSFAEAMDRLRREAGARPAPAVVPAEAREAADAARRQAEARAIWAEAQPIGGTIAETYLRAARRIGIALPDCLRFHPDLPGASDGFAFPAMIAAVTDLAGEVVAIQRTFLRPDGNGKAPVPAPKRSLGPVARGAVRLAPAAPTLGVAEGVETGLSAIELFALPVWCALGSNLARVVMPPSVRRVVIFADRGEAGERAAEAARREFRSQDRKVAVRYATTGKDFNDHSGRAAMERDGRAGDEFPVSEFETIEPIRWQDQPVPPRRWLLPEWVPQGAVTAIYGDGGTGKSLLAQQLLTCCATGRPFLGLEVMRCKALGVFCEDDEDELHRRQHAINEALGIDFADLEFLTLVSRVGGENLLMTFTAETVGRATALFEQIAATAKMRGVQVIVIDTAADTFGGNENIRPQVRQFISLLAKLARAIDGAKKT